jgi:MFS transporter, DHA3 family, multidrug efflux protein
MSNRFYAILANSLVAALTNTFVWFAVTFWVYLQTRSVLAMSIMAGVYLVTVAVSGFFLGSLVDRYPKKTAMMFSSMGSVLLYLLAYIILISTPASSFTHPASINLWVLIILALVGAIAGNIRTIALPTLVTLLIPEAKRDQANGLVGTTNGVSFLGASIFSGMVIGFLGMQWMLILAIALTLLVMLHLTTIPIPEPSVIHTENLTKQIDLRGTIQAIGRVPGLFGLIFFNCFNNFLGGVFMSLMDAYGLSLVSVQVWGFLWGCLSLGFIVGGLAIAKQGLGKSPLRSLFLANIVMWVIATGFASDSCGGSRRTNNFASRHPARTTRARLWFCPKYRASCITADGIHDWTDRPVPFHPVYDDRYRSQSDWQLVWDWCRSRHCAFIYRDRNNWVNRHVDGDAIASIPKIISKLPTVFINCSQEMTFMIWGILL